MARRCELTSVGAMTGNNVSHSHRKTNRRFLPNLGQASLLSETLKQSFRFRVSARALRSVDKVGGLDAFLKKAPKAQLSPRARRLKVLVESKHGVAEKNKPAEKSSQ